MRRETRANRRGDLACAAGGAHGHRAEPSHAERFAAEEDVDALRCPAPIGGERRECRAVVRTDEVLRRDARVTRIDRHMSDDAARGGARGIIRACSGTDEDRDDDERPHERTRRVGHRCLDMLVSATSEGVSRVSHGAVALVTRVRCTAVHIGARNTTRNALGGAALALQSWRSPGVHADSRSRPRMITHGHAKEEWTQVRQGCGETRRTCYEEAEEGHLAEGTW